MCEKLSDLAQAFQRQKQKIALPRILAHAVFDVQTRRRYLGAMRALACIHRSDACISQTAVSMAPLYSTSKTVVRPSPMSLADSIFDLQEDI